MDSTVAPATATGKRLWQIVRAIFVMLRKGIAKRRLFSDLRLQYLFRQGKLAGRSLRSLISDLNPHHPSYTHASAVDTFSCRFMEVEFSCSNTPCNVGRRRRHIGHDAAAVARAFEILDSVPDNGGAVEEMPMPLISVLATPAALVKPLRVTDSPFPVKEEEDTDDAADLEAEEFIREFYEQLRRQQLIIKFLVV